MSAVMEAREPSAKYLNTLQPPLVQHFELMATAPGGVARLRDLILTLAVQGKLVQQDAQDEPASELLRRIRVEKDRLVAAGKIKRGKPLAEISQDEEPFPLPRSWEWVRLNALLQKIGAGSTPLGGRDVYVPNGVKFLRSQNVWNDGLRLDGVAFIRPETHAKMNGTVVLPNDLLFNITGASIGRCAVVPSDFDEANVSQHVTIVRTVMSELNEFLHKVLVSRHVQQTVMDVQVGVSREGLSIAKLGQFLIPLPPLAEQARIVTRVEELMRLCDALESKGQLEAAQHAQLVQTLLGALTASTSPDELTDNWQRVATHFDVLLDRPEAIDALEQTILQLAVRGLLVPQDPKDEPASELLKKIRAEKDRLIAEGKIKRDKPMGPIAIEDEPFVIPTGWSWVRFDELIHPLKPIAYGVLVPGPDVEAGVPFVRIADLSIDNPAPMPEKSIGHDIDSQFQRTRLEGGEILMGVVGSIGKLGVAPPTWAGANIARAICRIVPADGGLREFVLFLLQTGFMQKSFVGDTRTLAQPTLNVGLIRQALTPVPPAAEQARIVARVGLLRCLCADLRQRLAARQTTQAHLAEALIDEVA